MPWLLVFVKIPNLRRNYIIAEMSSRLHCTTSLWQGKKTTEHSSHRSSIVLVQCRNSIHRAKDQDGPTKMTMGDSIQCPPRRWSPISMRGALTASIWQSQLYMPHLIKKYIFLYLCSFPIGSCLFFLPLAHARFL